MLVYSDMFGQGWVYSCFILGICVPSLGLSLFLAPNPHTTNHPTTMRTRRTIPSHGGQYPMTKTNTKQIGGGCIDNGNGGGDAGGGGKKPMQTLH